MKALIIYQEFASAAKASATLQHTAYQYAAHDADVRVHWKILPWRLEMLKFPPTAAEALAEAVDAHLIVFVGHCAQAVPGWLHIWLEEWAAHRHVEEAALAVMGDENTGGFTPAAIPELSQFARRHGLSVIFDGQDAVESEAAFPGESLPKLTLPITPLIPPVTGQRGWGLNE
jgi:hypothetical protein